MQPQPRPPLNQVQHGRRSPISRGGWFAALRLFVEHTLADHNFAASLFETATLLYGPRWISHPDNQSLQNYYRLVLESLAHSGDLQEVNHQYQLAAQGLATLDESEKDERRHRDQVRMQVVLASLTAALVVVGLAQVAAPLVIG